MHPRITALLPGDENLIFPVERLALLVATFIFVEEWESAAALDTHLASRRLQVPIAKLEGLIAASPDIRRYSILAAIA